MSRKANARGTYRKGLRETTAQAARSRENAGQLNAVIPGWSEGPDPESRDSGLTLRVPRNDGRDTSPARRSHLRKAPANPHREAVADLAIGGELLLAAAVGAGRILGRPVFDLGRMRARQFRGPMMRLGSERDDEVEIEPLP